LACKPQLLIADEPTTALDVTIQYQIIQLLEELQREMGMAVLIISHDLHLVRRFADRICVMQNGRVVEASDVQTLFANPQQDYTRHLLDSQPETLGKASSVASTDGVPVMEGRRLSCIFDIKGGIWQRKTGEVRALDDVDIRILPGETVGVVGESGSGKTTLGMCLFRLRACAGDILFEGNAITSITEKALRPRRRHFQVVFQDPYSSLSPRQTVEKIIGEGLLIHQPFLTREARRQKVSEVLREVGLSDDALDRFPHQFSGGQRQRIAIARAVIMEPKLILLDEPTSALDVSVQKQVLLLLRDLQARYQMAYLFITHDLRVIRTMAHRIIVMKDGKIVEHNNTEALFSAPQHAYTQSLLKAALFTAGG
jgi:microcin C transport system ATP-binding protein